MTYDEALYNSLVDLGYTGSSSDMYRQFLEDRLTAIGAGSYPAISDMLRIWLEDLGYTGTIQEMLNEYAVASGYSNHIEHVLGGDFVYKDYIYVLDGATQYYQFSASLTTNMGDIFQFKTGKPSATNATAIYPTSLGYRLRNTITDLIELVGCTGTVNGIPIVSGTTPWPEGESSFVLTQTAGTQTLNILAARGDTLGNKFDTYLKDFSITRGGSVIYSNSLTQYPESVQIPDVGTSTCTIVNYTSGGWVAL